MQPDKMAPSMSEIVVRPYKPRDQEQTWHVRAMTYNSGRPIPIEQQVYRTATPFVGEVDGRVVGTFVIMDMTSTRGSGVAWKTGGIAGVAVLPEARQTGVGGAMMRWALRHMRENGYVLASLYAFRESYYRKFGYEVCGMRYKITCPQTRLPRRPQELHVRRIPHDRVAEVEACYSAFARARSGMNLRNAIHWSRVLGAKNTIYAAGDPVEAYVIIEHDEAFWNEQSVQEVVWTTRRGYESVLSFLAQVGINKSALSWYEPSDSPFLARHADQGATFESDKPIMYRLLDFPTAVRELPSPGNGQFEVALRDPDLAENAGPWRVRFSADGVSVERFDGPAIELDCRQAVQALLGQPSYADLVRNGIVPESSEAAALFAPAPVYCTDFF